jgi:hypothetical protein
MKGRQPRNRSSGDLATSMGHLVAVAPAARSPELAVIASFFSSAWQYVPFLSSS